MHYGAAGQSHRPAGRRRFRRHEEIGELARVFATEEPRNLFWPSHVPTGNDALARPPADADIQERLQAKQYREAFAMLLPRYRDKVFRLTFSMLRDRALAEDTTQDIFLRVWRALPGFAGQSQLSTWIYAISKNACLSELRKRRPQVSLDTDEDEYPPEIAALALRGRGRFRDCQRRPAARPAAGTLSPGRRSVLHGRQVL